ncbi:MAG TPA: GAF domain-containing protein, partial [Candidatus Omnitrophota bacterium]|nr:GAF domain-containing protein [Candidatus Omnitrophota bacterium]
MIRSIQDCAADVAQTLAACMKQNDGFHVVLTALRQAGARMGAVCMPDNAVKDALVVRLSFGMEGASNKVLRRAAPRRQTAAERAFTTGEVVEADYSLSGVAPSDLEEMLSVDYALVVPIPGPGHAAGILLLVGREERDPALRELAERLARVLADHLEHLAPQPVTMIQPPAADTGSFAHALTECAQVSDIDALSEKVLDHCLRFTRSRFGFVGYVDPETGFLLTPTMTRDIFHQCQVAGKTVVFEKPGGLGGVVFDQNVPLIANDPSGHPSSVGTPPGHLPIRRFMGVPCMHHGAKRGMIGLANKEGDYNDNDVELVSVFAAVYAAAVARWYAERELADERRRFAALVDAAPCGFISADSEGVIHTINAPLLARLGIARDQADQGLNLADLVAPASLGMFEMQLASAKDGPTHAIGIDYLAADGQ